MDAGESERDNLPPTRICYLILLAESGSHDIKKRETAQSLWRWSHPPSRSWPQLHRQPCASPSPCKVSRHTVWRAWQAEQHQWHLQAAVDMLSWRALRAACCIALPALSASCQRQQTSAPHNKQSKLTIHSTSAIIQRNTRLYRCRSLREITLPACNPGTRCPARRAPRRYRVPLPRQLALRRARHIRAGRPGHNR